MIYLSGGPGDSPLVASTPGADALSEGDWWNETAAIRRRRDVVILSQRGAGGSSPNLDCFDTRTSDPARARRRAVTEQEEREILGRCRSGLERRKIDLAMYTTPALADDVADLAAALGQSKINIYGVSYGTRWALEVMRRHPDLVRAAVLDGVYPPQVNGEQNEPEIVRRAFEKLYGDCAADSVCRLRHPDLRGAVEGLIDSAERTPLDFALTLEDGPHPVKLDGTQVLMVLLNMMREGEAASIPETVAAARRGDLRLLKLYAEDLETNDGGLLEQNAQQFDGLYNSIECRETWPMVDRAARRKAIDSSGVYGLNARSSKSPTFCPVWRVAPAPPAERQPVKSEVPTLLLSGGYDWLTPPAWAREAAKTLSSSRNVVFRAQGHGVVVQDACAARLRDAFIEDPNPKRALPCRADTAPNFTAAWERVRNMP
jgi:pimeloyl-ACP methyl ester carboxylesterase